MIFWGEMHCSQGLILILIWILLLVRGKLLRHLLHMIRHFPTIVFWGSKKPEVQWSAFIIVLIYQYCNYETEFGFSLSSVCLHTIFYSTPSHRCMLYACSIHEMTPCLWNKNTMEMRAFRKKDLASKFTFAINLTSFTSLYVICIKWPD